jgi:hypothetical protein
MINLKSNLRKFYLLSLLFLSFENTKAQSPFPDYQVQANFSDITGKELNASPTAAAFTQYGKIPVSQFTGTANVTIPLYDIKVDNLDLPVYLSYNTQGVQPNNHAGWVGTGWSLFAGSAITRKVNGAPDEFVAAYAYGRTPAISQGQHLGWYYHSKIDQNNLTNNANWATNLGTAYPGALSIDQGALTDDFAPDEFDFNMNGISGAFFMGGDGKWKVRSNSGSTITIQEVMAPGNYVFKPFPNALPTPLTTSKSNTFVEFIITTGDGTQYCFGDDPNGDGSNSAIEFNRAGVKYGYNVEVVPNAWHITKIILPSKKQITFQYKRDGVLYEYTPGYSNGTYSMSTSGSVVIYSGQTTPDFYDASLNIIDPVYLKSITFPQGRLILNSERTYEADVLDNLLSNFNIIGPQTNPPVYGAMSASAIYAAYPEIIPPKGDPLLNVKNTTQNPASSWYKLDDIELDDYNGNKLKDIKFTYSTQNASTSRFFLNAVQEYGYYNNAAGTTLPPYTFSYNTTILPNYCSYNVDHWGFYNGPQSLPAFGSDPNIINSYNAFRTPNISYAQAGVLTQIKYPSGGTTSFLYELNRYKNWVGNLPISLNSVTETAAGGLRVKTIASTDNTTGQNISYTYDYVNDLTNNVSSGILGSPLPTYFVNEPTLTLTNAIGYSGINQIYVAYNYFSCNSIYPAHNSDGTIVTYTNVIERQFNSSVYNGMKTTVFSNHDNGYMDNSPDGFSYIAPTDNLLTYYSDRSFERGNILSESYLNSAGLPVKTVQNTYNNDPNRFNTFVKAILPGVKIVPVPSYTFHFWRMSAIRNYTYYPYLQQTVETDYPSDNSTNTVVTTKNYTYDGLNGTRNLIKSVITDSRGQSVISNTKYPLDYNLAGITPADAFSMGIANLQSPNVNAISVPVENTIQLSNADGSNLRTIASTLNAYDINYPFEKLKYQSNIPTIPLSSFTSSSVATSGTLNKDASYEARSYIDNYDGTGNLLQLHQALGVNQSYQWGYNNSYVVAMVKNAANSIANVNANGYGNIGISIPASSTQTYSQAINVGYSGTTTINYAISGDAGSSPNATASITVTGPGYSNTFYLSTSGSPYPVTKTLTGLTPGAYTISATCAQTITTTTFVNGTYPAIVITPTGLKEFYYEGFEESTVAGVTTGTGHTGHKYYTGATYQVNWTKPSGSSRTFVISYWYLVNGAWLYQAQQIYNGPSLLLSAPGATAYDDIRICPSDAQMTTYTYDYQVGVTSSTDAKSETNYYEYDAFQRLENIKDKDGNILKNYYYNYANQQTGSPSNVGNTLQSGTFIKSCSAGSTGSTVVYSVAANTYFSTDTASANQLARNDVSTNGPAYATAHGTCTVISSPYVVMNQASSVVDANGHTQNTYTFKVYSDANLTIPYAIPANLTVNYKITTTVTYSSGSPAPSTSSTNQTIVIAAGSNQATTGQIDVSHCSGASQSVSQQAASLSNATAASSNSASPQVVGTICTSSGLMLLSGTGYQLGGLAD